MTLNAKIKNIHESYTKDLDLENYNYSPELTPKLDRLDGEFDQDIINEIVLWKINRYAKIPHEVLNLLNKIKKTDKILNEELTREILRGLLNAHGVRLPMASTILRFKNPNIYQILDQRVYRYIHPEHKEYVHNNNILEQIELYINYLKSLNQICSEYNIEFQNADRILYLMDIKFNKNHKIKY